MGLKTNKQFVSRVIGDLKALSKDGKISRRLVLSIGKDKAEFLMGQKYDEMTLFKEASIISYIECFPMCEIDSKSCGIFEFKLCENLMKSKHKLPRSIAGKNGTGVISVSGLDGELSFKPSTEKSYRDQVKRKYFDKNTRFYLIKDGYLYLPNSEVELVDISMIAMDKWQVDQVSECTPNSCKSWWDYDFVCIDRLYESVVTNTVQELSSTWASIVPDSNPNLDPNQRTKTTK